MRRLRLVLLAAGIAATSLALASCGGSSDSGGGEATLDLTIGDSVPLSGGLADYGPPGDKAANVAVDQINKATKEAGVDPRSSSSPRTTAAATTSSAPSRPPAR